MPEQQKLLCRRGLKYRREDQQAHLAVASRYRPEVATERRTGPENFAEEASYPAAEYWEDTLGSSLADAAVVAHRNWDRTFAAVAGDN